MAMLSRARQRGTSRALLLGALVFPVLSAACRAGGQSPADAGTDFISVDVPAMADSAAVPLALDFSATGCDTFDPAVPRCTGTAPLTLGFTPVASSDLTRFLWTFGDDTPDSSERSPSHSYSLPGMYAVTLVGLAPGSGSLQETHAAFVNVVAAPAGAGCDVDAQCGNGLRCWCGGMTSCSPVLSRGLCSVPCDAAAGGGDSCPVETICADLSLGPTPSGPPMTVTTSSAWRRALCLPACANDTTCAPGLRCRNLPSGTTGGEWIRACFGGSYPLPIGARCGDAQGRPVHADCASHLCADLGAFYRCSADCSNAICPAGTGCAHLGDGRNLCVATCATATDGGLVDAALDAAPDATRGAALSEPTPDCTDDPLLACQAPGGTGPLGFTVPDGAAGAAYCSPKRCATTPDCGPAGTCPAGGGACQRLVPPP